MNQILRTLVLFFLIPTALHAQGRIDCNAVNSRILGHKIVGGLPLKKFYPELGNAALWCCTEITTRTSIDTAVGMVAESERSVKSAKQEADVQEVAR